MNSSFGRGLLKNFGLTADSNISIENARTIAKLMILTQEDWTEEMLPYYGNREAYIVDETNQHCILCKLTLTLSILLYMRMPPCNYRCDTFNYKGLQTVERSETKSHPLCVTGGYAFFAICQVFF